MVADASQSGSMNNHPDIVFQPMLAPAWMTLTSDGLLSGTPLATGNAVFALAVQDDTGATAYRGYNIPVTFIDEDNDGIFSPAGLNPGEDVDHDGFSNQQEYGNATSPLENILILKPGWDLISIAEGPS